MTSGATQRDVPTPAVMVRSSRSREMPMSVSWPPSRYLAGRCALEVALDDRRHQSAGVRARDVQRDGDLLEVESDQVDRRSSSECRSPPSMNSSTTHKSDSKSHTTPTKGTMRMCSMVAVIIASDRNSFMWCISPRVCGSSIFTATRLWLKTPVYTSPNAPEATVRELCIAEYAHVVISQPVRA
ncbi:hypothetical protein ON010_g15180 [Phytophthora cinnamomi]|nr:hypothetical protein ON010_g15180 [Phytophthora cinnamomi]